MPPSSSMIQRLTPQATQLRNIANAKNSIKRRRLLLTQQTGSGIWNELRKSYHTGKRLYQL